MYSNRNTTVLVVYCLLNSNLSGIHVPRLQHETRFKKETTGTVQHDSYRLIIPYTVALGFGLRDGVTLYATASTLTGTIRLRRVSSAKKTGKSVPVKIRQRLTKTYKAQKYYSTRVTVPIKFVKELHLTKGQFLDVDYTALSIMIVCKAKNDV